MNTYDPYPMGPSIEKERFEDKVAPECEENQKTEKIIENVFNLYIEEHKHSELIVAVAQMIMQYFIAFPNIKCENSVKLDEIRNKFECLLSYFKDIVEPELVNALNVLEDLQNEDVEIEFKNLTNPMKAKILHSTIEFQGEKLSLDEIIGEDYKILQYLKQNSIRKILLNLEKFSIGNICSNTTKYKIIERRFVGFDTELWCGSTAVYSEETENYETIKKATKESKTFILADTAGSGKTTALEYFTERLK
ncbi:hypothetical protein ACKWTF_003167 [Chironomus riparius]